MGYVLNAIYVLLLVLLAPWLAWKAWGTGKYRQGWSAKLLGSVPRRRGDRFCVWFHAVSVGEVNLLRPVLQQLAQCQSDWECVISTTTHTGYELARSRYPQHLVFYCPLDFTWATRRAMARIRPALVVLVELELWPNLIRAARRAGARVAIINGRLGSRSFRGYRRIGWLVRRVLGGVDAIAAQTDEYAQRFAALAGARRSPGAARTRIVVTGSVKFDGAPADRNNPATARLRQLAGFGDGEVVFLAGSTQEGEEEAALAAFRQLAPDYPQLRLVLVPRHAERFEAVAALLHRSGFAWQRRSALGEVEPLEPRTANETADPVARRASLAAHANVPRILLVDTIGELSAWWGTAQVGFVGGSLGNRGGQNMIEPAAYGVAVCFGPNTWNFRDIVAALLARQAAVVVHDAAELADFVRRCLAHQAAARQLGERARALVLSQQGAAARTVALLRELAQGCHRPAGAPGAPAAPHFSTTPAPGPLPPGNTPSHVARSEGGGL